MCITEPGPPGTLATGEIRPRLGINRFWPTYPVGVYPCRDGWLGVTTVTPSQWLSFCALLGLRELAAEPRYRASINRLEDADRIDAAIRPRLLQRTALEWVEAGQAARVPLALAPTPAALFELEQFRDRGAWVEAEHPDQGRFAVAGTPFRLHRTPAAASGRAPRLGEHDGAEAGAGAPRSDEQHGTATGEGALAADEQDGAATAAGGHGPNPELAVGPERRADRMPARTRVARDGPHANQSTHPSVGCADGGPARQPAARRPTLLQEIRIVDLTMGWAGPLATRQLADLGAEVIKVESCQYFDWWRGWESTPESIAQKLYEQSTAFNTTGRNKLGITLDLTSRRGKDLLLRLVATVRRRDRELHGQRPAEAGSRLRSPPPSEPGARHGVHAALRRERPVDEPPRLRLDGRAGFGATPPERPRRRPADHAARRPGRPDRRHQRRRGAADRPPPPAADRRRPVRRSLPRPVHVPARRPRPDRAGGPRRTARARRRTPPGLRALGRLSVHRGRAVDHGHSPRPKVSGAGCARALCMDAEDDRFASAEGRKRREDELDRELAARTTLHDGLALERRLAAAGVPAAVLRNTLDVLYDPHLEARGYWQWRERAYVGNQPNPSAPFRPAARDGESRPYAVEWPAPTLGEHNREVLSRLLDLSELEPRCAGARSGNRHRAGPLGPQDSGRSVLRRELQGTGPVGAEPASGRRAFLAASGGSGPRGSAHPENDRVGIEILFCNRHGVTAARRPLLFCNRHGVTAARRPLLFCNRHGVTAARGHFCSATVMASLRPEATSVLQPSWRHCGQEATSVLQPSWRHCGQCACSRDSPSGQARALGARTFWSASGKNRAAQRRRFQTASVV